MTTMKLANSGYGAQVEEVSGIFQAKGASFNKGDVVMVSMDGATYLSDEPTANTGTAATTSPFTVVVTPTAAAALLANVNAPTYYWFGVCQEDIAQNAYGRVMLRGRTKVLVSGTFTRGMGIVSNGTGKAMTTPTYVAAQRILGWAVQSGTTGTQCEIFLEGINTIGAVNAIS